MKKSTFYGVIAVAVILLVIGMFTGVIAVDDDTVVNSDNSVGTSVNSDNNNNKEPQDPNALRVTFKYRLDGSDDYFKTFVLDCEKEEYISVTHPTVYGYEPNESKYEGNVYFSQTIVVTYKPVSADVENREIRTVTYSAVYTGNSNESWYQSTIGDDIYYISSLGAFNALASTSDMLDYVVHGTTIWEVVSGPAFDFVTVDNPDGGSLGDLSVQSKDAFLTVFNYDGTLEELKTLLSSNPLTVKVSVQVYEDYFN